ncbi:hypothetical protein [uncultured Methanobrevibacter sp.]|uniref:hypothetical protein n=1 Tax=uncultured Methanobrevibacter sp. TaxID=253161 RepID=UPI0025D473E6|nr:hypothetical protein [uncultured Methanobrevibacter sp.]
MKKNHMIIIAIVFLILFGALAFLSTSPRDGDATNAIIHNATLNVSSEGPIELSKIIDDIKTADYYKGYDNETVKWMESLGNKYVFVSEDAFVVMDKSDSDKIPSIYACDVIFNEIFSCDILENHTLGNVKYPKDVLYVENVKYIREEAFYFEV